MELCMSHPGIKRLGSGQWRVRVTRTDERSGRRLDDRKLVQGSLRDALEEQARMRVALDEERPQRIRLRDYATGWFEANEVRWRHSTRLRFTEHVDELARGRLGGMYLDAIRPVDCEDFLSDLVRGRRSRADGEPGDPLSAYSVRGLLAVLHRLSRAAARDHRVDDFAAGVTCPIKPRGYDDDRPNCLTRDQFMELWRVSVGSKWLGPILLTGVLGMRTCEVFALRWADVEDGVLRLRRSVYRGVEGEPKTTKSRRALPLPPEVASALPPRRDRALLLYPGPDGDPLKAPGKAFNNALARLCERAGVPRVTPHGLRRTTNTTMVDLGIPAETVRAILGHTDNGMTARYYHAGAEAKATAVTQALAGLGVATSVALGTRSDKN
jgi:integrase